MRGTSPETVPPPREEQTWCECPQGFARLLVFRHRQGDLPFNSLYRRQQVESQGKGNISLAQLPVLSLSRAKLSKIRGSPMLTSTSWVLELSSYRPPNKSPHCCKRLAAHVPTTPTYPLYSPYISPISPLKEPLLHIAKNPRAQPGYSRYSSRGGPVFW